MGDKQWKKVPAWSIKFNHVCYDNRSSASFRPTIAWCPCNCCGTKAGEGMHAVTHMIKLHASCGRLFTRCDAVATWSRNTHSSPLSFSDNYNFSNLITFFKCYWIFEMLFIFFNVIFWIITICSIKKGKLLHTNFIFRVDHRDGSSQVCHGWKGWGAGVMRHLFDSRENKWVLKSFFFFIEHGVFLFNGFFYWFY
jgi:hypothetical protein